LAHITDYRYILYNWYIGRYCKVNTATVGDLTETILLVQFTCACLHLSEACTYKCLKIDPQFLLSDFFNKKFYVQHLHFHLWQTLNKSTETLLFASTKFRTVRCPLSPITQQVDQANSVSKQTADKNHKRFFSFKNGQEHLRC
jgi:hypothetical protein